MKYLERRMSFSEAMEFLRKHRKYSLTKDISNIINNQCKQVTEHRFSSPVTEESISSLIRHEIRVEYSDSYVLEMMKHVAIFGNTLDLKLDRPELKEKDVYNRSGLSKEPIQEWTKRIYLQANSTKLMLDYVSSDEKTYVYGGYHCGWQEASRHETFHNSIRTKNLVLTTLMEIGLTPEQIDKFAGKNIIHKEV